MILVDIWPISWRNFVWGEAAMQTVERAFEIFDQAADVDTINDRLARELAWTDHGCQKRRSRPVSAR